jgi:hypothetical protein
MFLEINAPVHKIVYITTDGPLSQTHIVITVALISQVFV